LGGFRGRVFRFRDPDSQVLGVKSDGFGVKSDGFWGSDSQVFGGADSWFLRCRSRVLNAALFPPRKKTPHFLNPESKFLFATTHFLMPMLSFLSAGLTTRPSFVALPECRAFAMLTHYNNYRVELVLTPGRVLNSKEPNKIS